MSLTDLRKDPVYLTSYIVCNTFVMGESIKTAGLAAIVSVAITNKQTNN